MNEGMKLNPSKMVVFFFENIDDPLSVTDETKQKIERLFTALQDVSKDKSM